MNQSGNAVIRIAAMGIVLILAAVLGLVAGNALNARDGGAINPGAALPHLSGFDGARYEALESTAIGAPAAVSDRVFPNVWGNVAAPDPVTSESWGNVAAPDPVTSESWGNIGNDAEAARDSMTAPELR